MKANRQIAIFVGLLVIVAVPVRAQENEFSGKMITEAKAKAEAGDATAQCDLGLAYCNSDGVTKNLGEPLKWLRKSADQNNAKAQYNLGVCHFYGEGVTKGEVEAYKWISLSAAQGHYDAKKALPTVEGGLTTGQISKAQQLVREFKPRKPAEEGGFDSR